MRTFCPGVQQATCRTFPDPGGLAGQRHGKVCREADTSQQGCPKPQPTQIPDILTPTAWQPRPAAHTQDDGTLASLQPLSLRYASSLPKKRA